MTKRPNVAGHYWSLPLSCKEEMDEHSWVPLSLLGSGVLFTLGSNDYEEPLLIGVYHVRNFKASINSLKIAIDSSC